MFSSVEQGDVKGKDRSKTTKQEKEIQTVFAIMNREKKRGNRGLNTSYYAMHKKETRTRIY